MKCRCAAFLLAAFALRAADSSYRQVENWAHFPASVQKWEAATGVDVDARGNVYVLHRNQTMPIMAFDRDGTFVRAWGQGMIKTTHFLRGEGSGSVWATNPGD